MLTFLFYLFSVIFFFIVAINLFLGWALRSLLRGKKQRPFAMKGAQARESFRTSSNIRQGTMVSCAYCQVYVPQESSLQQEEKFFCSKEHKELFNSSQNSTL